MISIKHDKYGRKRERKRKFRLHSNTREVMQEPILRDCVMSVEWCVIW
jgi:hypothetical protein